MEYMEYKRFMDRGVVRNLDMIDVMNDVTKRGECVTHVLTWKVYGDCSENIYDSVKKIVYEMVNDVQNVFIVGGIPGVSIRWLMPDVLSSGSFYTNSVYSDVVTNEHVKIMLKGVVSRIKSSEKYVSLRDEHWGVSYMLLSMIDGGCNVIYV